MTLKKIIRIKKAQIFNRNNNDTFDSWKNILKRKSQSMKAKQIPGIPDQKTGAFHDTESQKDFQIPELTFQKFSILKERFFLMDHWKDYCGKGSAEFKVFDLNGKYANRIPKKGDFVRVDIPGPGDFEHKGYDWVEITELTDRFLQNDEMESYLIICKPSGPPKSSDNAVAHFYSRESSSCFRIARGKDFIRVGIYGRNETPNTYKKNIFNKIRSFLISLGGSAKLTKIEWKCLAEGLLDNI